MRGHVALKVAGTVLAVLICMEALLRALFGVLFLSRDPEVFDPIAGRIQAPGVTIRNPFTWTSVTITEEGVRSNGDGHRRSPGSPVLAVGDSFVFGEQVDDNHSWPAFLEEMLGRRVVNGARPGIGLDQAVLRVEQLVDSYAPDIVIVGFIPDDIRRSEMAIEGFHPKPYFTVGSDGTLELHPMERPPPRSFVKEAMARSIIVHSFFQRSLDAEVQTEYLQASNDGNQIGCLLMKRLSEQALARKMRLIVLAQPQFAVESADDIAVKDHIVGCARENDIGVADLFPVLGALPASERESLFFPDPGHMTPDGNRFVAEFLHRFIALEP